MPQMTPLVLKDRGDPIATHTFIPKKQAADGTVTYVESTGIPVGDRRIAIGQTRSAQGRVKATLKLTIPVVQDAVVNGISSPKVVRTSYADVTFNFDPTSTARERDDLIELVYGLCDRTNEQTMLALVDLQGLW